MNDILIRKQSPQSYCDVLQNLIDRMMEQM